MVDRKNTHQRLELLQVRVGKLHKVLKDTELELYNIKIEIASILEPHKGKQLNKDKNKENFNVLLAIILDYHNLPVEIIFTRTNKKEIVNIRKVFCYILKDYYSIVEAEISRLFKEEVQFKQDRTTIFHHVEEFKGTLNINDNSLNLISQYKDILNIITLTDNNYGNK